MKNSQKATEAEASERERILLGIFEKPLSEAEKEKLHFQHYEGRDALIGSVREEATRLGMRILGASDLRDYTEFKEELSPTYFLPNELDYMLEGSDKAPTIFEVVQAKNNAFLVIERQNRELAVRLHQRYQNHLENMPLSNDLRLGELVEENPGLRNYLKNGK